MAALVRLKDGLNYFKIGLIYLDLIIYEYKFGYWVTTCKSAQHITVDK